MALHRAGGAVGMLQAPALGMESIPKGMGCLRHPCHPLGPQEGSRPGSSVQPQGFGRLPLPCCSWLPTRASLGRGLALRAGAGWGPGAPCSLLAGKELKTQPL